MREKKQKPLFRARKTIPAKVCWFVVLGLIVALAILLAIPYAYLGVTLSQIAIWTLVPAVLLTGIISFPVYAWYLKAENRKNAEVESMQKRYDSLKREVNLLKTRVATFDEDIATERNKKITAEREREAVLRENAMMQNYKQTLKEIYMCSKSADTRAYAEECFKHEDGLDLFQPIRYLQDTNYAKIIEMNAEELLQILVFHKNRFGLDSTYEARKRLKELLKKGGIGVAGTSTPILARDKQPLKKLDTETER